MGAVKSHALALTMNRSLLNVIVALLALGARVGYGGETREQHDARLAWWREARFGMFVH
jgi:hypothetical protein